MKSDDILAKLEESAVIEGWRGRGGNRVSEKCNNWNRVHSIALLQFINMYNRWKRKQGKEVKNGNFQIIFDQSLDDEQLADDLVLASRMDSYLLIIIHHINNPKCKEIQRNQRVRYKQVI